MLYESLSAEETMNVAETSAKKLSPGTIVCLSGDLGSGKTVFAKGFARGLGVSSDVTSPTFAIINSYNSGVVPFHHFDVYRIKNISEMEDTGYEDYFYGDGVCLVEWAEMIAELIPSNAVWVKITKDLNVGSDYRRIEIL